MFRGSQSVKKHSNTHLHHHLTLHLLYKNQTCAITGRKSALTSEPEESASPVPLQEREGTSPSENLLSLGYEVRLVFPLFHKLFQIYVLRTSLTLSPLSTNSNTSGKTQPITRRRMFLETRIRYCVASEPTYAAAVATPATPPLLHVYKYSFSVLRAEI